MSLNNDRLVFDKGRENNKVNISLVLASTEAYDKIVEIGKDDVNKFNIYIKFGCNEDHSNKTTTSYIIIK
jgi:hypothetical protein